MRAAAAAVVVLHVLVRPPAPVPVHVEVACEAGPSTVVDGTAGEDLRLPVPCPRAEVRVTAEDAVPQRLWVTPGDAPLRVTLPRLVHLRPDAAYGTGDVTAAVWWRPADGSSRRLDFSDPRSLRLPPGEGCLAVLAGDRVPVISPLRLEPGATVPVPPPSRQRGWFVRGVVVEDGSGNAVAARVEARRSGERPAAASPHDRAAAACRALAAELGVTAATTDNSGAFRLGPLDGRSWSLHVSAEGYAPREVEAVPPREGNEADVGEIRLQGVGTLTVVLDTEGCPEPPPYRIRVEREVERWVSQRDRWLREMETTTDGHLPVVVEDLAAGSHRVRVDTPGGRLFAVEFVELAPGAEQRVVIHLQPLWVSGTVRREGEAVAGAQVRFVLEGSEVSAETDGEGEYRIALWTPGDYGVLATALGEATPYAAHLDLSDARPGDERTLDIELPSHTVAGVVVDRTSHEPVEGTTVALTETVETTGVRRSVAQRTGEDGSFRFTNVAGTAPVTVRASAEGYLPTAATVDPLSLEAQQLVLELERSAAVRGRVVDPGGGPVPGAQVMCCPVGPTGGFTANATADGEGRFVLDARAGEVLWAVARGHAFGWARAAPEGETVIVLQAPPAPTTVELRTPAGDPVVGVEPLFSAPDGTVIPARLVEIAAFLASTDPLTDAGGALTMAAFPPGTYEVWLRGPEGLRPVGAVPVPSSGPVVLTVPSPR